MKRLTTLFLLTILILTALFCTSCGKHEAEAAAEVLLDRCIACDTEAMSTVMGYEVMTLTDIEQYTLTRMQYKIIGSEQLDSKRRDVIFDTNLFDIMTLLNDALAYSVAAGTENTFDSNRWVLQQLNTNQAVRASFRAVLPMIQNPDGTWSVDPDRIGDDVRDALSGGAFSWYAVYRETFEGDAETTAGGMIAEEQ